MKKERRKKAVFFTTGFTSVLQKNRALALLFFILLMLTIGFGCSDSTKPKNEPSATIEILQNGVVQQTITVKEGNDGDIYPVYDSKTQIGEIEVEYLEHYPGIGPDPDPIISFLGIGRKNGYYTVFDRKSPFDTLRFDYQLDFNPVNDSLNCGTMYQRDFGYVRNAKFSVCLDSVFVDSLFTDSLGRFETNLQPNSYILTCEFLDEGIELGLIAGYGDYFVTYYYITADKPNIYLYPENTIELDVSINFPQTGEVTISDPHYPEKWQHITVEPDGTIDEQYRYLFYESKQPNFLQRSKGWVVHAEELEGFFRDNMKDAGFIQPEIDDFVEYWMPRLTDSKFYALYPQYNKELDPLIQLNFSIQPDNILRLIYVIEEVESDDTKLEEPKIPEFKREGFAIAEWGVVLLEEE